MDVGEIRKLILLMQEAGLTELEVEDRSGKIRLVRGRHRRLAAPDVGGDGDADPARDEVPCDETLAGEEGAAAAALPPGMTEVLSPMVGTFYRAASPDAAPFVAPGDVVRPGQVLCIIEAMKMMNEVAAEATARIVSIQAESGAAVEYGSPLFLVELLE